MKKTLFFIIVSSLLSTGSSIYAQQWRYYNPTSWFDVNTVEIPGPGIIVIGGGHETNDSVQVMFQSPDYGLNWHENPHDGFAPWNMSVAFSDSLNGFGVGYDGRTIRTDNAGLDWGWPATPVNRDFNKIVYVAAGTYFIAGGNKTNDSIQTILKSTDYGNTWNVIYDTLGPWLKSIFFINTMKGFAIGDNGVILATINSGHTWSSIASPILRDFNAITFINADTGYIAGGTPSGLCRRTILQTVNGGLSWSVLMDSPGGILKDISFASEFEGYTVGDSSSVLKTMNGGLNWFPIIIDTGLIGNETFNAVKFHGPRFGVIAGKSGVLYVYKNLQVEVFAYGTIQTGTTDATLYGGINTHTKNARYFIVYSDNINLTTSDSTPGINVQNDSLLYVSKYIQGLSPNTTYYYFLKATTSTDTVYSDTLRFYTLMNSSVVIQTLDATHVTQGSANLNGFLNKFPTPADLYFEYGTGLTFGSQVAATPSLVNDTLRHTIRANINGLLAGSRYFFRLKGVTGSGIYYGDTKAFFTCELPSVYTGNATITSSSSARLNGNVMSNGIPAAIRFEYGPTTFYGNEVNAVPDSVTSVGSVDATCLLTGLSPTITYHCRLKAINTNGTSYGEDMTFITSGPIIFTLMPLYTGINSAELAGTMNANGHPTANIFEYGLGMSYGNEVAAIPNTATGNNNINISCSLTGLLSGTAYHYRVKAINATGTAYGNDMTFTTGIPPSVTTLPASDITLYSAALNGSIDAGGIPTAATFEYGTTTAYGNEIVAIPDSTSSIGIIDAYNSLSGLMPNTTYHFRMKGTNGLTTKYGEDMLFYTGYPEIPNFDFEDWSPIYLTKPSNWDLSVGKVTAYTPSCHNNLAVKLENAPPEAPGVVLIGNSADMGQTFQGGTPFNARPDSLIGCFNYYIPDNDTALVVLLLKKQGIIISDNWYEIYGNSSGNYVELKFPIQYSAAGNSDSLIIALTVTDMRHQTQLITGGYLIADYIHFTGTTGNFPNSDFEDWDTTIYYSLDNWWYAHKDYPSTDHPNDYNVRPTNDAQHGSYALLLQNFIYPTDTMKGVLTTNQNPWSPGFRVNTRHQSLTGYYKFFPENGDSLFIQVEMYKNHNKIGSGNFISGTLVQDYMPFIDYIYYQDSIVVPDSGQVSISAGRLGNSRLYIDNLNFDGYLSGIKKPAKITAGDNFNFNVYPNPFNEKATVTFAISQDRNVMVRLFDLSGKQVAVLADERYKQGEYKIHLSVSGLGKGFYICVMSSEDRVLSKKLIIY